MTVVVSISQSSSKIFTHHRRRKRNLIFSENVLSLSFWQVEIREIPSLAQRNLKMQLYLKHFWRKRTDLVFISKRNWSSQKMGSFITARMERQHQNKNTCSSNKIKQRLKDWMVQDSKWRSFSKNWVNQHWEEICLKRAHLLLNVLTESNAIIGSWRYSRRSIGTVKIKT